MADHQCKISFNRNEVMSLLMGSIEFTEAKGISTTSWKPFGQFYGLNKLGKLWNAKTWRILLKNLEDQTVGSIKLEDINGDGVVITIWWR